MATTRRPRSPERNGVFISVDMEGMAGIVHLQQVMRGMPGWEKVIEKYRFNLALIPVDTAVAQLLKQRPEWRVVADNGKEILLVLRKTDVRSTSKVGVAGAELRF